MQRTATHSGLPTRSPAVRRGPVPTGPVAAKTSMQAATIRRYGGPEVVTIEELPLPVAGPGELRIRVSAAGVTAVDARLHANDAPRGFGLVMRCITGLTRPRHLCSGWSSPAWSSLSVPVRPGERLLINGATGSVGSAAVQIGRHLGA